MQRFVIKFENNVKNPIIKKHDLLLKKGMYLNKNNALKDKGYPLYFRNIRKNRNLMKCFLIATI